MVIDDGSRDGTAEVAQSVWRLADALVWIRGRSGPFASLNFERAHAHSVIVGPGGLEDRADIRVGLTYMEPYSRFPDHVQRFSRAFDRRGAENRLSGLDQMAALRPRFGGADGECGSARLLYFGDGA